MMYSLDPIALIKEMPDRTATLNWVLKDDLPVWLSANPIQGTLQAGGSKAVTLKVDRDELPPGAYAHTLLIISDGGDETVDWERNYGGTGTEHVESVITTLDMEGSPDAYLVVGSTYSFGAGGADFWLGCHDSLQQGGHDPEGGDR